jgi:zinc transporter ZupT
MTPLGGLLGSTVMKDMQPSTLAFLLGLGAGTFLFMTASGIVPELLQEKYGSFSSSSSSLFKVERIAHGSVLEGGSVTHHVQ